MIFAQAKKEIQDKFEGGTSFSIDWSDLFHEAARITNQNINPRSTKRRVPVYGGLSTELPILTCPTDISVPAALYVGAQSLGGRVFKYQPPKAFFTSADYECFTIDYINGIPFIMVRTANGQTLTLDSFLEPATFSGVTLSTTVRSFIYGSNALFGTFTDTAFTITKTLPAPQNLADYGRGVALVPFYAQDVTKVASVTLRLRTDATNFFQVTSTQDSIGDTFINGWNLARFDLANKTIGGGSPVISNIGSFSVLIPQTAGQSQAITLDKITLHQTTDASFEYYSTKIFKNAAGEFLDKPIDDADTVELLDEEMDIFIYEVCRLVIQNATYDSIDSKQSQRFDQELQRKYELYNDRHPSSEMPLQYNISSDIELSPYDNRYL